MSKSTRKVPYEGITGERSQKQDKQLANRSLRRAVNNLINGELEDYELDLLTMIDVKDVSDVYSFAEDGKRYVRILPTDDPDEKKEYIKKLLRK